MKYTIIILALSLFILSACKNETPKEVEKTNEPQFSNEVEDKNLPLDERVKKQAMLKLGIPANEKFSVQIHQAYLNNDNQSDAIITINRLAFATHQSENLKTKEILKRNGYIGNYNYIIVYDGATNQLSIPIPIPSSAMRELEVDFEYLFSESYSTPVITYRIKDTEFKNFYAISDGIMDKVFKMISYEYVGSKKEKAYVYKIQDKGMFSFAKDIKIFNGKLENSSEISNDWFGPKSKISGTQNLDREWYFDPKRSAYVTPN